MKIKETDWGMGCRIQDTIFLNKNLKKYPKLYSAVLKHEESHTSNFGWQDVVIDINGSHFKHLKKEYYKFMFKYPKALATFAPIWIYDGDLAIDVLQISFWLVAILITVLAFVVI